MPWAVLMVGVLAALLPAVAGAEGELPEGIPECPGVVGDAPLDVSASTVTLTADGRRLYYHCIFRAGQGETHPRYDYDTGLYRTWGYLAVDIQLLVGGRGDLCPVEAGVRTYTEDLGSWPSGLAGSWLKGQGSLLSPTHHAILNWSFREEDGVTPALAESVAMDLYDQMETLATPCEPPDPDEPIGPAGCPAAIGEYVLFERWSDLEPELVEASNTTYLRVECEYAPPYDFEGRGSDDRLVIRAGWIEDPDPVELHPSLDREGQTCTSRRVPVALGDSPYVSESDARVARAAVIFGDTDPSAAQEALDAIVAHLEGIAAACPATGTTTTTTSTAPVAEEEEAASCSPSGTVTDHAGAPMPGLRVRLHIGDEVVDQRVTDAEGWYQFSDLSSFTEGYGFDPAADSYQVGVVLRDAVEGASRFEIRYGPDGALPDVRRPSTNVVADPGCVADFDFAQIDDDYEVFAGPEAPSRWRSLAHAYQGVRRAHDFAVEVLDTPLTTPLAIYVFCKGNPPGVHGAACGASPAYFRGGFSNEAEPEGPPFVAFNVAFSSVLGGERPINGEYHEFGHALMADAFGGFMPNRPNSRNHAGYSNPTSTDSWTEGFAEWFATQVARHVDGSRAWWLYPVGGQVINLEDDIEVTGNRGKSEEMAIAGILIDMVDGDADYAAPTRRQLTVTSAGIYPNPEAPGQLLLGIEVRNDMSTPQSDVGVKAEFAEFIGSTRVDGFVEPTTLQPGQAGVAVVRVPTGLDRTSFRGVRVVGLGVGDDDGVSRTTAEVWQAILSYRSGSEHSKGFVMDTSELYEALREAFPSDATGIDGIFVAHGVFADRDPRNGVRDATEDIGVTSPDGTAIRLDAVPDDVFRAVVATGGVEARVLVQVLYPEPRDALSYAYSVTPDEDGSIFVAVPPQSTEAVVQMVVFAEERLPALLPDLAAGDFWAQAEGNDHQSFLAFDVDLPVGDPLADPLPQGDGDGSFPLTLVLLGGAALLLAGAGFWWRSRRGGAAPAYSQLPPREE